MSEKLKRFTDLMQEIFELDKSDLDFGIYRIMNIRKTEIEKFLNDRLPELVQETLEPFAHGNKEEIRAEMAQIEKSASDMGMAVDDLPETAPSKQKYTQLRKQLAEGTDLSALKTDVYSALYSFFNRYYEEGDFISKRRYKEGVYAIPYEGEEVKLYWANQDQYYIKTSENFKDYSFTVSDHTVHFRLVDATTEQNNNKESKDKKRVFMLFTEDEENHPGIKTFEYNEDAKEFIIRFIYDIPEDKKKKYDELNYTAISEWLLKTRIPIWQELLVRNIPSGKSGKMIDLLEKHLKGYVAKNTFDYFIHKDLRGFLSRELDFYIKSEVMHLDDLDTDHEERVETYLAKVKAIKRVGKIIIDFLAQIEDFQKKLWLKKKFVVETNWCMTLDKVDESFWQEIIENNDQINEWIALYAIDEAEGWATPPSVDFLRQNQNLIIDTKHFSYAFKEKLVASIENLDEQTNGLLINGDNFHALKLLIEKYYRRISCIYGDPPYNAKSSEILYKNSYKHSSWMAMMQDRLYLSSQLKSDRGAIVTAIDENEGFNLAKLLDGLFPEWDKTIVTVLHNPAGVQGDNFSYSHEYAAFVFEKLKHVIGKKEKEEKTTEPFRDWGPTGLRNPQGDTFYPIYVSLDGKNILGFGEACNSEFHPGLQNIIKDKHIEVYPIGDDGTERKWVFARASIDEVADDLYPVSNEGIIQIHRDKSKGSFKTVWDDKKYYANIYGSKLLNHIMGSKKFDFPKSLYTVSDCVFAVNEVQKKEATILDYFAGSATTGHAVVNMNRKDHIDRKYILVEMGEYFDSVTKPRMQKVIYSTDWKNGKPQNRNTGVSQIIKYMTLESYEDALSNIQLDDDTHGMLGLFSDDYMIHYMLDIESQGSLLNLDAFRDPFSYRMKITEKNECKERPVDVIETFSYLIGLTVTHQGATAAFTAKATDGGEYEGAVELQKDIYGQYAFRQIEGTLPDGRRALVIWRRVGDNLIESNAALDAYFRKYRVNPADREYDIIYVNGDNNLENLRTDDEAWKVQMTELEFKARMFEEE